MNVALTAKTAISVRRDDRVIHRLRATMDSASTSGEQCAPGAVRQDAGTDSPPEPTGAAHLPASFPPGLAAIALALLKVTIIGVAC